MNRSFCTREKAYTLLKLMIWSITLHPGIFADGHVRSCLVVITWVEVVATASDTRLPISLHLHVDLSIQGLIATTDYGASNICAYTLLEHNAQTHVTQMRTGIHTHRSTHPNTVPNEYGTRQHYRTHMSRASRLLVTILLSRDLCTKISLSVNYHYWTQHNI